MAALRIRLYHDGQRFLLWDPRHAYVLRCAHRIVGSLVGALATNKRQTAETGMPLCLLFEEALLAVEEGFAEVVDVSGLQPGAVPLEFRPTEGAQQPAQRPSAHNCIFAAECAEWTTSQLPVLTLGQLQSLHGDRQLHAAVYRALWQRGHFVTTGSAFGSDYLCYPADPFRHHAHMMVHVVLPGQPLRAVELACFARLAASVKKSAFLAVVGGHATGSAEGAIVQLEPVEVEGAGTAHMSSQAVSTAARALELNANAAARAVSANSVDLARDDEAVRPHPSERQVRRLVQHSHQLVESEAWGATTATDEPPPCKVQKIDGVRGDFEGRS